jgi:hypothetical protein
VLGSAHWSERGTEDCVLERVQIRDLEGVLDERLDGRIHGFDGGFSGGECCG